MTFSIIIPVYNVAPYLRECLDSVLAQTYTDWEAICVDDGSTDGSGAILDEYAEKVRRSRPEVKGGGEGQDSRSRSRTTNCQLPTIRVIHQENKGVSAARNAALDVARGEWVCFLDGDDVYRNSLLAMIIHVVGASDCGLVRYSYGFINHKEESSRLQACGEYREITSEDVAGWAWNEYMAYGQSWRNAVRRDVLDKFSDLRFNERIYFQEDTLFLLLLSLRIQRVRVTDYIGYYYRPRASSATGHRVDVALFCDFLNALGALYDKSVPYVTRRQKCMMRKGVCRALVFDLYWYRSNHCIRYGFSEGCLWRTVVGLCIRGLLSVRDFDRRDIIPIVMYMFTGTYIGCVINQFLMRLYAKFLKTSRAC